MEIRRSDTDINQKIKFQGLQQKLGGRTGRSLLLIDAICLSFFKVMHITVYVYKLLTVQIYNMLRRSPNK